uniref:Putative ovule protein n=1 Tax=Solanum chacoense TaxID=4108 RepID=A0A0V0HI65_SOLCH
MRVLSLINELACRESKMHKPRLCCAGMQFAKLGQRMPSDSTTLGEGLSPVKGALLLARLFSSHYV